MNVRKNQQSRAFQARSGMYFVEPIAKLADETDLRPMKLPRGLA